jgi:hypothetical protein
MSSGSMQSSPERGNFLRCICRRRSNRQGHMALMLTSLSTKISRIGSVIQEKNPFEKYSNICSKEKAAARTASQTVRLMTIMPDDQRNKDQNIKNAERVLEHRQDRKQAQAQSLCGEELRNTATQLLGEPPSLQTLEPPKLKRASSESSLTRLMKSPPGSLLKGELKFTIAGSKVNPGDTLRSTASVLSAATGSESEPELGIELVSEPNTKLDIDGVNKSERFNLGVTRGEVLDMMEQAENFYEELENDREVQQARITRKVEERKKKRKERELKKIFILIQNSGYLSNI